MIVLKPEPVTRGDPAKFVFRWKSPRHAERAANQIVAQLQGARVRELRPTYHCWPMLNTANTDQYSTLPTPAFYRLPDVLRITGLSRPTLYRRIAARRFPPPVHLGGRACGWPCTALQAWIADPEGYRAPETVLEARIHRQIRPAQPCITPDHTAQEPPRKRGRPRKYAA